MLAQASIVGFVPVSNFQRAEDFYAGKLGLTVTDRDNPYALVLATADGTMIRCILVPQAEPRPFTILGWEVPDIAASIQQLTAAGIELLRYPFLEQSPEGIWTAPGGAQIAWFNDPDGNVLSLSQHPFTQRRVQRTPGPRT